MVNAFVFVVPPQKKRISISFCVSFVEADLALFVCSKHKYSVSVAANLLFSVDLFLF